MKPPDRLGDRERDVIAERRATGYRTVELEHFGGELEPVVRALLERLLPGVPEHVDLVAFVDARAADPLGRGDHRAGVPAAPQLYLDGLRALAKRKFAELSEGEQRALITRMRKGEADRELGMAAKDFVDRLLDKALAGYLAHPDVWERIGFTGPAFPEGYAWIGPAEVVARHQQAAGWRSL